MAVVLITGGSRGIGRAMVEVFSEGGHTVVFTYKSGVDSATELEAARTALGASVKAGQATVEDPAATERVFGEVEEFVGPVDVLINNAGVSRAKHVAARRGDHQHRGRRRYCRGGGSNELQRVESGHHRLYASACERGHAVRHSRQCDRARIHRHRYDKRPSGAGSPKGLRADSNAQGGRPRRHRQAGALSCRPGRGLHHGPSFSGGGRPHIARISHQEVKESARKVRQYETRDTWRAQAYFCSPVSMASKHNEVVVYLMRAFTGGW